MAKVKLTVGLNVKVPGPVRYSTINPWYSIEGEVDEKDLDKKEKEYLTQVTDWVQAQIKEKMNVSQG